MEREKFQKEDSNKFAKKIREKKFKKPRQFNYWSVSSSKKRRYPPPKPGPPKGPPPKGPRRNGPANPPANGAWPDWIGCCTVWTPNCWMSRSRTRRGRFRWIVLSSCDDSKPAWGVGAASVLFEEAVVVLSSPSSSPDSSGRLAVSLTRCSVISSKEPLASPFRPMFCSTRKVSTKNKGRFVRKYTKIYW